MYSYDAANFCQPDKGLSLNEDRQTDRQAEKMGSSANSLGNASISIRPSVDYEYY
jgi:hypothetical protein